MGYWGEDGEVWGDSPADIMGDAVAQMIAVFTRDMGRLPTKVELLQGIYFTLGGPECELIALPEQGNFTACPSEADARIIANNYYPATRGDVSPTKRELAAGDRLYRALDRVQGPYNPHGKG